MKSLFAVLVIAPVIFLAYVFHYNLPNFCAHPERPGNWIVQPFCK